MSRFDIDDDGEQHITWEMWQHNVQRALKSARGQAKLKEFKEALLAVPNRRLVEDYIADLDGDVCALGAFIVHKRVQRGESRAEITADLNQTYHGVQHWSWPGSAASVTESSYVDTIDPWTMQDLAMQECGLNRTLAWELGYANDEGAFDAPTPEKRWRKAYAWVCEQLGEPS